jgi:DnaJ domain
VPTPDHYAALGVSRDATPQEIREAWRFALVAFHPDRFRDDGQRDHAERMAKRVNGAWQVLSDPMARQRYDRRLDAQHDADSEGEMAPMREIPCPSCASLAAVADQGGRVVGMKCPSCGQEFSAAIGAVLAGRPELDYRFLGARHVLHLVSSTGEHMSVTARHLPKELALTDGEMVSVVLHPVRGTAIYVVTHGRMTNLGWKVG